VDVIVREANPIGKADTLGRVRELGGTVRTSTEIAAARLVEGRIEATLSGGEVAAADQVLVQIGFLSARDTFERLELRLNEDGSIAIDPYYETSRRGIFAVGDVHGDIKLITVAWAEGIQAAIYAFKEITSPYWLNEKRLRDYKLALMGEKMSRAAARLGRQGYPPEK
jgi:pyruvate/2-oxoglutarate dehydrogenase complex dihydrolipoamide dehydrogenase (E3) component